MITQERIATYIKSLEHDNSALLAEMETKAIQGDVPIIRKEMESFLRVMIGIVRPKRILELGTAIGYSAVLMSECMPEGCKLETVENYPPRISEAKSNFQRAERGGDITLIEGDAGKVLSNLSDDTYDFIFLDSAKAQYHSYIPDLKRVLKKGGVLITDNVFKDGDILEARFAVTRRDRTIHKKMREYLKAVKSDSELETSIVPIGDGITLSYLK